MPDINYDDDTDDVADEIEQWLDEVQGKWCRLTLHEILQDTEFFNQMPLAQGENHRDSTLPMEAEDYVFETNI